jgi:hypothetical protein
MITRAEICCNEKNGQEGVSARERDARITQSSVAEPKGYAEALTVAFSSPVLPPHLQS